LEGPAALSVMTAIKSLTQSMAVICTIHQPNKEIVAMFDDLLLCSQGQIAYFGPMSKLQSYLSSSGFGTCPEKMNIADFTLDVFNEAKRKQVNVAERFTQSAVYEMEIEEINKMFGDYSGDSKAAWPRIRFDTTSSFPRQFHYLLARFFANNRRDKASINSRLFIAIFMSFLVGTLFYQLGSDQLAVQSRFSVIYMLCLFVISTALIKLPDVFLSRPLYFRETTSGTYRTEAYFCARLIADLPLIFIEVFIFCVMIYFLAGLTTAHYGQRFALLYLVLIGARLCSLQMVFAIGGLCPTIELGNAIVSVAITIFNLFSGFLISKSAIPNGWIWMYYLDFIRYPLTFGIQNEMLYQDRFTCDNNQLITISNVNAYSNCPLSGLVNSNGQYSKCPIQCGAELLSTLGISAAHSDMALNGGLTWLFAGGFAFFAYLALKYVNHITR
jgi:ATP-binding cassette subfamily G (WHITE) protein 2 (SNQ2)